MPTQVSGDVELSPIGGEPTTVEDWTSSFHLALMVVDPFTHESAWVLEQAGQMLRHYAEADCRTAWLVTGSEGNARQFLGPWATEMLTFTDPGREAVTALELETLPAFVVINADHAVDVAAQGWDPAEWQEVADRLAGVMSWTAPNVIQLGGPAPFEGSPAAG